MPKGLTKKIEIDRDVFIQVLKEKGVSIRYLGSNELNICSEKTIRRALIDRKMSPDIFDKIARYLDVYPDYLSGKIHERYKRLHYDVKVLKSDKYPYIRKQLEDRRSKSLDSFWEELLLLFEISKNQFDNLDFDTQYNFQHDFFEAIIPIIYKYFDQDGFGDKELANAPRILLELESYYENYYELKYADEELREMYISDLPRGYTKNIICKMTPDELIGLDFRLSELEEDPIEKKKIDDYFEKKYGPLEAEDSAEEKYNKYLNLMKKRYGAYKN